MEDPAPPTVYTSPVPEEPSQRPPRARQGGNANNNLRAQIQALSERLASHEEVIRRLGAAFASLAVLQDHARYNQGYSNPTHERFSAPGYERGHYHNPNAFSGRGRRGGRRGPMDVD